MRTSIILVFSLCLTSSLISAQLPNYFQSNNPTFPNPPQPNSGYSGFQSQPSSGLPPLNSAYSAFQGQSGNNFQQYQPYNNRIPSVPQSSGGYPNFPQFQSSGFASYPQSPASVARPQPVQSGNPFSQSWNINHVLNQPQQQFQSSPPSFQPQPQAFNPPQSYSAPQPSTQSFSSSIPQSWNTQSLSQYRPQPQSYSQPPVQSYNPPSLPSPAPQPQYQPQPTPQQSFQSTNQISSPQNSQNFNPAPVHYASIGSQLQGDYKFGYHTGDGGSFREESRLPDGTVQGAYGFIDANGKQRIVKYTAGKDGFKAEGDDVPQPTPVASLSGSSPQYAPQSNSLGEFNLGESPAYKSFMQG